MSEHIVLEWIGKEYEAIKSDTKSEEFLKINPKGSVPAMQDGDSGIMTQNNALLSYLAQKFPETGIAGDGSEKQTYEINHWLAYVGCDLHPSFRPIFSPNGYTTSTDDSSVASVEKAAENRVEKELDYLNKGLEGRDYLVTEQPTVADAYAFVVSRWYESVMNKNLSDKFPNIAKFNNRMMENDAVSKIVSIHNPKE